VSSGGVSALRFRPRRRSAGTGILPHGADRRSVHRRHRGSPRAPHRSAAAERWNVPVLDNVPASGSIARFAAKAPADDTLPVATGMLPALQPKQPFDPDQELAPVAIMATSSRSSCILAARAITKEFRLPRRPAQLHYPSPATARRTSVMELSSSRPV
jgi:hypothetical protein